jgi:hypothetical protein
VNDGLEKQNEERNATSIKIRCDIFPETLVEMAETHSQDSVLPDHESQPGPHQAKQENHPLKHDL